MSRIVAGISLLSCFFTAGASLADRVPGGVRDVASIENENGEGRVLLRLEIPQLDENALIRRAVLRFEVPAGTEVKSVPLRIHPVTTPWNAASVDWSSGWSRPGGDFPEDLFVRAELQLGREAGVGIIDLTPLIKETIEDGFQADGFIVSLDPNFGEGIREAYLGAFANLESAQLELSSRTMPPPPREAVEDSHAGIE